MKRNKKLQAIANQSLANYKNDDFGETLKTKVLENKRAHKRNKKIIFGLSTGMGVLAIIVVCLLVFIPSNGNSSINPSPIPLEKNYTLDNQEIMNVSIDELNIELNTIKFSPGNIISAEKVIDNYYNEILYFVLEYSLDDGFDYFNIVINVNKDYNFSFTHETYDRSELVNNLLVDFIESAEEDYDIFYYHVKGEINNEDYKIYIKYDGVNFEPNNNFINALGLIIQ